MIPCRRVHVLVCGLALLLFVSGAEAGQLRVAWDPNTEPDIAGYVVSYGTSPRVYDQSMDVGLQTDAIVNGLTSGQLYYIAVQAYTADRLFSDYSAEISGVVPPASAPRVQIDTPGPSALVSPPFVIAGWAIDAGAQFSSGIDAIHVYAYPSVGGAPVFLGAGTYGGSRPDVAAIFGPQFSSSGFSLSVGSLAPGDYLLVVYARSMITGVFHASTVSITVRAPESRPVVAIDTPSPGAVVAQPFAIVGWAADLGATTWSGIDAIHVWAYPDGGTPVFAGVGTLGGARPDVAAIVGPQFGNSGFSVNVAILPPANYLLVIYPHSALSGTFGNPATLRVTVSAPLRKPLMAIDTPASGAAVSGPFALAGWAVDMAASSGPGVDAIHVWAYPNPGSGANPVFVGAAAYGGARLDVGAVLGQNFTASGFNLMVQGLPAGVYDLVVYAHSSVTGTFNNASLVRVTVH